MAGYEGFAHITT